GRRRGGQRGRSLSEREGGAADEEAENAGGRTEHGENRSDDWEEEHRACRKVTAGRQRGGIAVKKRRSRMSSRWRRRQRWKVSSVLDRWSERQRAGTGAGLRGELGRTVR